jgi:hypothetical protein
VPLQHYSCNYNTPLLMRLGNIHPEQLDVDGCWGRFLIMALSRGRGQKRVSSTTHDSRCLLPTEDPNYGAYSSGDPSPLGKVSCSWCTRASRRACIGHGLIYAYGRSLGGASAPGRSSFRCHLRLLHSIIEPLSITSHISPSGFLLSTADLSTMSPS